MTAAAFRHTYGFDDAGTTDRAVLGGKGAGLVAMVALGLPVPPGFVVGTDAGRAYLADETLPDGLVPELDGRMAALEAATGRRFGDPDDPLLVSVRSGAPVSMPGMMDTILNLGLTMEGAERLAERSGDARFAWTSMERLLDGFVRTVRGISAGRVEDALLDRAPEPDPALAARARAETLAELLERESGSPLPEPRDQLREAAEAVFGSWNSRRAQTYRKHKGIDSAMGTAVVVQAMVFGNRDDRSGSGVGFTRDPSTGARGAFGDLLFSAQGEDVVSGECDTEPLTALADRLPDVHAQLLGVFETLERDARDLCDVEFTVESGRLYILQTRVGQRSGRAAVALAVDLVDEGLITVAEAVDRVDAEHLAGARSPRFIDEVDEADVVGRGLAASPGAAVGRAAFDVDRARSRADAGDAVVLVRPTTASGDLPGVMASVGVVTGRGGRTSHAAVVARGMGKTAVCGIGDVVVASDGRSASVAGQTVREGDELSVDGDVGVVSRGARTAATADETDPILARFLSWRDDPTNGSEGTA
ncbi:pyruvate, phosphate dikinase [Actinomycetospora sp.]|uniref:pyruvate, phosphate dikinase n=1 Tax=Actinomycetospora sp. TaxID=1872135 RepID=UPI002F40729A